MEKKEIDAGAVERLTALLDLAAKVGDVTPTIEDLKAIAALLALAQENAELKKERDQWRAIAESEQARANRAVTAEAANAELRGRVEVLANIAELARELVSPAGMVNRGVERGLVVVEKADKSDPHYRLCKALAALARPEPAGQENK